MILSLIERFFIIISIFSYIKSDNENIINVEVWEDNSKSSDLNISDINSYAFDSVTGAELFLYEDKTKLYLKENSEPKYIPNTKDIKEIQSPLIKIDTSSYLLCGSLSDKEVLINIKNDTIKILEEYKKTNNKRLKCLRGPKAIVLVLKGDVKITFFDYSNVNEFKTEDYLAKGSIIDFCFYEIENNDGSSYKYSALLEISVNQYKALIYKKAYKELQSQHETDITNLKLFDITEIGIKAIGNIILFIFSYNNLNDYNLYSLDLTYTKTFLDITYYFRFFNNFRIEYIKFIEGTLLVYYKIEAFTNDKTKYIGLADLQTFIVVYNIRKTVNTNLYFNNYIQKLLYFTKNQMIEICPFIEENNNCLYINYIDINQENNEIYKNSKVSKCYSNKVENDKYCTYNCSLGYQNNNGKCETCSIFVGKYVSFVSRRCLDYTCIYNVSNGICYDCPAGKNNKNIYFNDRCIENCSEIFGVDDPKDTCKICKESNLYYSFAQNDCINKTKCTKGEINDIYNYCRECSTINKVFYEHNNTCIDNCDFFQFFEEDGECLLCTNISKYYQNGKCVGACDKLGYGIFPITYEEKDRIIQTEYCTYCKNISEKYYVKDGLCSEGCGSGHIINDTSNNICQTCGDNESFYVEKLEICLDKCPKGSREILNHTCSFCGDNLFYYENGNDIGCLSECNYEIQEEKVNINENTVRTFNQCKFCDENQTVVNHKCRGCLDENNYLYKNFICYSCFCGGNPPFSCYEGTNRCNCLDSPNYYGYSCEFYSDIDIKTKNLTIISLNDRLIKTSENYFSFKLTNNEKLPENITYSWKFFLNGTDITNDKNYQDIFITSPNEKIFGINKRLFEEENNKFDLELYIMNKGDIYLHDNISFVIIKPFEYENYCEKGQGTSLGLMEIVGNFALENRKKEEGKYNGKYFYQYGLIDENEEKIPLTNYIDEESNIIDVICSKGYYTNIKNDREEINESIKSITSCTHFKVNDLDLNNNKNYSKSEKLFLLISNFKYNDQYEIQNANISDIDDFIKNDIIPNVINENGYYEESLTNRNNKYLEPKLLFSFLYNYANFMKPILNENSINKFFDYFSQIFDKVFTKISYNTLSKSDIKSLFRTIDNLYDICIEKNFPQFYGKFVDISDNITKYLFFRSFPSQTFHLKGKRISLLLYTLGKYEKSISFPFIYSTFDTRIKNISSYTFNNYYLNEQDECKQEKMAFFCINKTNYENLINKIYSNKNETITDAFLSFYLLSEISQKNEKNDTKEQIIYDDEDIEKITVNRNYSTVIKLFKNVSGNIDEIKDKYLFVKADIEFPYRLYLDQKDPGKKNEMNITLFPDNKDYSCISKSYFKNPEQLNEEEKLNKYTCFTHFDYDNKIVRCSCNFTSGEEIMVIKNSAFSEEIKRIQFKKTKFELTYKFILFIIYLFIFLLLIPSIYYLLSDIIKETKEIKNNAIIKTFEEERKKKYNEVKRFYNKGIIRFSFYLFLNKYPLFSVFNTYIDYPRFIKHLIVSIGLFIGFIVPLVPYLFMTFSEREDFVNQRDIKFPDSYIKNIPPDNYKKKSLYFSILSLIFTNLFIYIFGKLLNYEKKELDIWIKIKTICKDYIYYEIKSEVLLGAIWKKIKLRMLSYYYICGNYILNKKRKKEKNNKSIEYLKYITRNYDDKNSYSNSFNDVGGILPRSTISSNILNISKDINSINNNEKSFEMAQKEEKELLLDKDDEILLDNSKVYKNKEKIIGNKRIYNNNIINNSGVNINCNICKIDNFRLDNNTKNNKSKRTIERYEKVRNKYIYVHKKNYTNEMEIDERICDENDKYCISPQINYLYLPEESFTNIKNTRKNGTNITKTFIVVSLILIIISVLLIVLSMCLIKAVLNKFDEFILKVWILPVLILLIVVNLLLYYIKMLIGSFLLFKCYHLRKKNRIIKCLFWLFVDKTMIQMYKIKNLITKYKKEFDYL